ncbi:MAG TPA: hypothetical protein VHZ55_35510 [Bryobacteraceae bacterium]|jgi:hypothetical protein|nr:hypothetical protein [Bryobacteraceae bacterium]
MLNRKRSASAFGLFVTFGLLMGVAELRAAPPAAEDAEAARYAPLWAYNGRWQIKQGTDKVQDLLNQCALIGKYFSCQQSVNGAVSELLVIIPGASAGLFSTQSILPDGRAGGKGGLEISGNRWIFSSNWNQGGKTTFYKTINTFTGDSKIQFEQQESPDNTNWKTVKSGEELRVKSGVKTIIR